MRIADPHVHIWDLGAHRYPWLDSPGDRGVNGHYRAHLTTAANTTSVTKLETT